MGAGDASSGRESRLGPVLLAAYGVVWLALAIAPKYRSDWLLENALVLVTVPALVALHRRRPLSDATCVQLFAFYALHSVGSHYTYAEVPYDAWWQALAGETLSAQLGLERNHFDRLVHFLFGLLLLRPVRELFARGGVRRGWASWLGPVCVLWALSGAYELVEWWAAELFGGDLGIAYLGSQGDPWDAQKDMALAHVGALLAAGAEAIGEVRGERAARRGR